MSKNLVWRPKKLVKCCICDSNHGHKYKVVEHGIWWVSGPTYVTYNFCSICFTVIKELWPHEVLLVNNKKFVESGFCDRRDDLDYIIKNNPSMNSKFTEHRIQYVNKLDRIF